MAKAHDSSPVFITNTPRAGESEEQTAIRNLRSQARDRVEKAGVFELPDHGNRFNPSEARAPRRYIGLLSSEDRKKHPMATGCLDYFPDALAYVSHVSWRGNEKHNPGQPLHWARGKSMDHPDCIMRHLVERGFRDDADIEHAGSLAWRALAELQQLMEKKYDLDPPRAAVDTGFNPKA